MSNHSTVSLNAKTTQHILEEIEAMRKSLDILRKRIIKIFPPQYGSNTWWEKEITQAKREVKAGRIKELDNLNQLDKPLDKLFA